MIRNFNYICNLKQSCTHALESVVLQAFDQRYLGLLYVDARWDDMMENGAYWFEGYIGTTKVLYLLRSKSRAVAGILDHDCGIRYSLSEM